MNRETKTIASNVSKKFSLKQQGVLMALIVLIVIMYIVSPTFRKPDTLISIIVAASLIGIVAAGETFVIMTGGIDLSVGSNVGLVGVITAALMVDFSFSPVLAILIGLFAGAFFGLMNGLLITKAKLPPFIATLGTMQILSGLMLVYLKGNTVFGMSEEFCSIATGKILGIPNLVVILAGVYIICWYILRHTKLGIYALSIGGNETATKLSGVNVDKYKINTYVLCGLLSGLSGILLIARLNSAILSNGEGWELNAIAGVIIGGTSMSGGTGTIHGTLIGIMIVQIVEASLTLLSISSLLNDIIVGSIVILAVSIDALRRRKAFE